MSRASSVVVCLAAALAAVLAGCSSPSVPDPLAPGESAGTWHDAAEPLWVAWSTGCGHCSGSPEVPEFMAVGLYRDGKVLTVAYSAGRAEGVGSKATVPGELRDEAEALLALDVYAKGQHGVLVHDARAETLSAEDHEAVRAALDGALRQAEDPPPSEETICSDCGGLVLEAFGAPVERRFAPNLNAQTLGPALAAAAQQMSALWAWAGPMPVPSG